jgi:TRAP-type mannitol/chloroaromatic compound transport system permease small subunit
MLKFLLRCAHAIDWLNQKAGRVAVWLVLVACLVSAGTAFARYAFNVGSNAWLEIQWYMFAAMVMLGAAYTLKINEHVRVDIFYGSLSARGKARLDLAGLIFFLMPAMLLLAWLSWPFFISSWQISEVSSSPGGLIRWPAKLMLPLGFVLVALQGVAEIIKRIAYLRGVYEMDLHYGRPLQ